MELFTVNRYKADESVKSTVGEDDILNNLLQKVEKRKRDRSLLKQNQKIGATDEFIESKESTKAPKRKQAKLDNEKDHEQEEPAKAIEQSTKENGIESTNDSEYRVLGEDVSTASKRRPQKAEIVLPAWLAHPTIISTCLTDKTAAEDTEHIANYPYLAPHILQSLKELKVSSLFPVQSAVIPWILQAHRMPPPFRSRDICVSAPTGSGKTLAFAIPVVQLLAANRVERKIRALVVLPVAELATQVFKVFKKLCEKTDLSVLLFSQQTSFPVEQENLVDYYKGAYHSKADIVVTTPGRLVDHLHATKGFCLKSLKFLIIDEADRIMDAVFQNWFYHLDTHVRSTSDQLLSGRTAPLCYNELVHSAATQPHKLLFSATLSQDPEKLQNMRLFQPKLFTSVISDVEVLREHFTQAAERAAEARANNDNKGTGGSAENRSGEFIGKYTTPAELTEKICLTESNLKPLTLYSLIKEQKWRKFLCFTNSGDASKRLTFVLSQLFGNHDISELSGSMSHNEREKCLANFVKGHKIGLVCSDAMARGIDVDVDVVISYDPPRHIKTYIHRIGRTARAGRAGTAVTLLTSGDQKHFHNILAEVGKRVTEEITVSVGTEESSAKSYADALKSLRYKIRTEKTRSTLAKRNAKALAAQQAYDPAAMTIMQKMQVAVDDVMASNAQADAAKIQKPERRLKKRKSKAKKTNRPS